MKTVILLVEDSRVQRFKHGAFLGEAGYEILYAGDGKAALGLAREKLPHLILLDMMLPKLGGPEVLQALKQDPATAPIPVLVLSGLPQSNEGRLLQQGAAAYFEKSRLTEDKLGHEILLDKIQKVLRESPLANAAANH